MPRPVDSLAVEHRSMCSRKFEPAKAGNSARSRVSPTAACVIGVRAGGRIEIHSEGVYHCEWREGDRRQREAIPNHSEVLERARLHWACHSID